MGFAASLIFFAVSFTAFCTSLTAFLKPSFTDPTVFFTPSLACLAASLKAVGLLALVPVTAVVLGVPAVLPRRSRISATGCFRGVFVTSAAPVAGGGVGLPLPCVS